MSLFHVQIHCENAEALVDAQQRAFDQGFIGPEGHYISRPPVLEVSTHGPLHACKTPQKAPTLWLQ